MSTGIYPRLGTPLGTRQRSAAPSPSPAVPGKSTDFTQLSSTATPARLGATGSSSRGKGEDGGKYRLQRASSTNPTEQSSTAAQTPSHRGTESEYGGESIVGGNLSAKAATGGQRGNSTLLRTRILVDPSLRSAFSRSEDLELYRLFCE